MWFLRRLAFCSAGPGEAQSAMPTVLSEASLLNGIAVFVFELSGRIPICVQ